MASYEGYHHQYIIIIKTFINSSPLFCIKYLISTGPYVLHKGVDSSPPKIFEVESYPRMMWCCSHLPPLHQKMSPPDWAAHILSSSSSSVSLYTCSKEVPPCEAV